jgi:hypothetical protein
MRANNEMFEAIQSTFISRIDFHQARTLTAQEEMKATRGVGKERMETAINSVRSELEETIKHRLEDVLSCVEQKT